MQYESAKAGRIFTVKLNENDPVYESILTVARNEGISRGVLWIIGGVKNGRVIVGPEHEDERPIKPMQLFFSDSREIVGLGTIFPDEAKNPSLHIHAALGKTGTTITGCPRISLDCWLITEIIIQEITNGTAYRKLDENGFHLLTIPE